MQQQIEIKIISEVTMKKYRFFHSVKPAGGSTTFDVGNVTGKERHELVRLVRLLLSDGSALSPEEIPQMHSMDGSARSFVKLKNNRA
jgi:hypothetical protein